MSYYAKAIREFETARQQQPADSTVRFSLGFMYWKVRRFEEAAVELREALKIDPKFDEAKFYLADTYLTDQKPEKALPILEGLVESDAKYVRVCIVYGNVLDK